MISKAMRQQIFAAANHRCEYCQTSRRVMGMPLVIDHILPRSLGGGDEPENLAAACYRCNEFKRAKIDGLDSTTGQLVPLFHPRQDVWSEHFQWVNGGIHIAGLTPTGRATVAALHMNNEYVVESRALWIARDWHPPTD
ncbi:MAG: HNH endonuclease [Anaerolineae bacterium]